MATALDLIQDSAEAIGVYAPGETISAADSARMLKILNDMLDSWSNEALSCYVIREQSHALSVGVTSYTIGAGGTWDMARPIRILDGPGAAYILDTNGNRYPVDVVPRDQWNRIWNITSVNSNLPDTLFYDPQFPLGIMNIYPNWSGGLGIVLYWDSYLPFTAFANLIQQESLPPGYVKAIQDSLALQFIPYFKGDNYQVPPILVERAATSKANIKRSNIRENVALLDYALSARGASAYNIYSDTYR